MNNMGDIVRDRQAGRPAFVGERTPAKALTVDDNVRGGASVPLSGEPRRSAPRKANADGTDALPLTPPSLTPPSLTLRPPPPRRPPRTEGSPPRPARRPRGAGTAHPLRSLLARPGS
jgi:hypothetical protein